MMDIRVRARLHEKTALIDGVTRQVYGLADFYTKPTRRGIGTHCLRAFEDIARRDGRFGIVAFPDDDQVLQFYLKSGYYLCGKYEGKSIVSSFPAQEIKVSELW